MAAELTPARVMPVWARAWRLRGGNAGAAVVAAAAAEVRAAEVGAAEVGAAEVGAAVDDRVVVEEEAVMGGDAGASRRAGAAVAWRNKQHKRQ